MKPHLSRLAVGLALSAVAIRWAAAAESIGRPSAADQAKPVAAKADPDEAGSRFELAKKLVRSGDPAVALTELLWCWDEGRKDPDFMATRTAQVPSALMALARSYPPAGEAMVVRRDQAREKVLAGKGGASMAQDLIALNTQLKDDEDSLAVFDQLPADDRRRVTFSIYLFNTFVDKKRYADAVLFYRPEGALMMLERVTRPPASAKGTPALADTSGVLRQMAVDRAGKQLEALAGAGRLDEARSLLDRILLLDDSEETRAILGVKLKRAGHPELV